VAVQLCPFFSYVGDKLFFKARSFFIFAQHFESHFSPCHSLKAGKNTSSREYRVGTGLLLLIKWKEVKYQTFDEKL
jgi:hypothetical protein